MLPDSIPRAHAHRELGFTLLEVLVAISIVALLLAFILPAAQQARESARHIQCRNNLKQIGIALHSYHNTNQVFPIGLTDTVWGSTEITGDGWAWGAAVLPYLDQATLYNRFNFFTNPYNINGNQSLVGTPLSVFSCPSDVKPPVAPNNLAVAGTGMGTLAAATSSYMGCAGPFDGAPCVQNPHSKNIPIPERRNIGLFQVNTALGLRNILDGSSNVFALGEVRWIREFKITSGDIVGSDRQFIYGNVTSEGGPNCANMGPSRNGFHLHNRWTRKPLNGTANPDRSFHSMHPGGANFLMADGSVRFVSDSIDHTNTNFRSGPPSNLNGPYGTYQRLAGIGDGQIVSDF